MAGPLFMFVNVYLFNRHFIGHHQLLLDLNTVLLDNIWDYYHNVCTIWPERHIVWVLSSTVKFPVLKCFGPWPDHFKIADAAPVNIINPAIIGMQQLNVLKVYYITNQSCINIYFIANQSCISGSLSLVDIFLKICVFGQWHTHTVVMHGH